MNKIIPHIFYNILLFSSVFIYSSQNGAMGFTPNTHYSSIDPETDEIHTDEYEDAFFKLTNKIIQQLRTSKRQYIKHNKRHTNKKVPKKNPKKNQCDSKKLSIKDKIIFIIQFAQTNLCDLTNLIEKDAINEKLNKTTLHFALQKTRDYTLNQFNEQFQTYNRAPTDNNDILKNNDILRNITFFANVLFLQSKTEQEISSNKTLGKKLAFLSHPDKTNETNNSLLTDFFRESNPLLMKNKKSPYLDKILENINKELSDTFYKSSPTTIISTIEDSIFYLSYVALPTASSLIIGKAIGHLLPNKGIEKELIRNCTINSEKVALNLAEKSLEIQAKLSERQKY